MRIIRICLSRFRNYADQKAEFADGLNIIRGRNAQGKTNIVEAVFLCCVGKSPRTAKDRELIMWESESGSVRAEAARKFGKTSVEIYLTRKEKKRIRVNGIPINRMGELMGNIKAVYFHPDDLKLVKDSPDCRRRFLDVDLSQLKKSYFYSLGKYQHILLQRNNLLKEGGKYRETLDIWDGQLAAEGEKIVEERRNFLERLKGLAEEVHDFITDHSEKLELSYESGLKQGGRLLEKLVEARDKDFRLGYTTVGPHRDDVRINVGGVDLRLYGSQGQQRTAALSMKLAELELFSQLTGEYPVLLLDDVLSELDRGRQRKLLERIGGVQAILTCTEADPEIFAGIPYRLIEVEAGRISSSRDVGKNTGSGGN